MAETLRAMCVLGLLLVSLGCVGHQEEPVYALRSDSTRVHARIGAADTIVALFYDPADCLVCESPLGGWRVWSRASEHRSFVLTFTRAPSATERHLLVTARLDTVPWLLDSRSVGPPPLVHIYDGDRLLDSARGRRAIGYLFARWATAPALEQ